MKTQCSSLDFLLLCSLRIKHRMQSKTGEQGFRNSKIQNIYSLIEYIMSKLYCTSIGEWLFSETQQQNLNTLYTDPQ